MTIWMEIIWMVIFRGYENVTNRYDAKYRISSV
jgi:hypothetical protein